MAYINYPLISPSAHPGGEARLSGLLRPHADLGGAAPALDQRKPPVPGFGFSHRGDLGGRGRQTSLAFVKLDLGARDVNADGPSLPWMHPRAGKILFGKRMLLFCKPWVSVKGPPELLVSVPT